MASFLYKYMYNGGGAARTPGGDGVHECWDQDWRPGYHRHIQNKTESHQGFDTSSSGRCSRRSWVQKEGRGIQTYKTA